MKMGKVQFLSRVGPLLLGVALMMVLASSAFALVWNSEIIDSDGYVGSHTSLALDSNNLPHISYGDLTKRDLKYTRWDGSDWQIETVDSEGAVGQATSLVLDSNDRPHISYSAYSGNELKYAYWDGSNWIIETVDSEGTNSSLALDSQGRPHIAYNGHDRTLKYARWDGSNWLIEEISKHNYLFLSLALDSNDQPHISYLHLNSQIYQLIYARWDGVAWVIEVVDNKNRAGYNNTLKLDSHDLPHISYHANNELKYARWNGSVWVTESIGLALHSSLALDDRDRAHISYHIDYNLKYWKRSDGLTEIIEVGGDFGWPSSLALDSNNQPHIGYYDNLYGDLKYTFAPIPALTVCASGCDHTTIQDAINAANPDDTIEVEAGTYLENLTIDKNIILQGADQATTIIDGQAQGTVVTINPNITVRMAHVTITNGLGNSQGSGTHDGGGIFNQGNLTLWRSTISENHADSNGAGGGIWNGVGDLTLIHSMVSNNTSPEVGGGIANIGGLLNVSKSTISDNVVGNPSFDSNNSGGGIYNSGELLVSDSTIDGNMAIDQGGGGTGLGGGIYNTDGSVTINSSTISHNLADDNGQGGGIYNTGGSVAMSNSTISNNMADDNGQGGGIYNLGVTGTISLYLSTINENSASTEGGGIYNRAGSVTLSNSIVANSANGEECFNDSAASGTVNDDNFNIVEDNSCGFSGGSDPQLGPLADNGGPTLTHLPEDSSPAIDNVRLDYDVFCAGREDFINDQRGVSRLQGAGCDSGAIEVQYPRCSGLIQEAEHAYNVRGSIFEVGRDSAASAGRYVHVPEGMGNNWNRVFGVEYCFTVETDGIYKIKGWVYAESGRDNSFFVQVDRTPTNGYLWEFPKNTDYQIDEVSNRDGDDPVLVTLSEGQHIIEILVREDGARLDKLELELIEPVDPTPLICDDLVAEAEEGRRTGAFMIGDDGAASGGQYIHVPEGAGNSFNTPNPAHKAEYCFNVETAGTYRIKGDIYADSGRDNSFFVQVDDASANAYLWDFPKNTTYQGDEVSDRNGADPVEVELQTGPITVTVFLREDGARLDKLELVHVTTPSEVAVNEPMARGILGTLIVNNYQGEEELDLTGIKVTLQDANSDLEAELSGRVYNETTEPDPVGNYYFDGMPLGSYTLTLDLPNGYLSEVSEAQVTTSADEMVEQFFDLQITEDNSINIYLPLVIRQ